jgi:hypothetical protein
MRGLHAAELQLPEAWLSFVDREKAEGKGQRARRSMRY